MGKNSAFYKEKDKNFRIRLKELKEKLPVYTYDFLDEKSERNPHTAVAYACDLLMFFEYVKEFCPSAKNYEITDIPIELLENLNFQDINEYQKFLDVKHPEVSGANEYANQTAGIARRMAALRGMFKYAVEHQFIQKDPTVGATKRTIGKDDHVIVRLTTDEVNDLLSIIRNSDVKSGHQKKVLENSQYRDFAILMLLLNTGIRVSECVGLDINDLNFRENYMTVVRKGGKEQNIYFSEDVAEAINDYIELERPQYCSTEDEPALFLSLRKSRIAVRSVQEMVKKYSLELGTTKKISPHKMRSTYGTALYNETGDIRMVADVLGHSDINTTAKHYAAMEDEHRRQAAKVSLYGKDKK